MVLWYIANTSLMRNKKDLVKLIFVFVAFVLLFFGAKAVFNEYFAGTRITPESNLFFPFVTISSLIDSINPCAFSVLLLTVAFLFSLQKSRKFILLVGGAYILGIFVVYFLIGLGMLQALTLFGIPNFVSSIAAWLVVLFGVTELLGHFFPNFPVRFALPRSAHPRIARFIEKGSLPSAFVLGGFVALFEFPCTGGPYLMILGLLHDSATYLRGIWYLLWYNIVFVLPLIAALVIASSAGLLAKVEAWRKENTGELKLFSGIGLILLGVLILLL